MSHKGWQAGQITLIQFKNTYIWKTQFWCKFTRNFSCIQWGGGYWRKSTNGREGSRYRKNDVASAYQSL